MKEQRGSQRSGSIGDIVTHSTGRKKKLHIPRKNKSIIDMSNRRDGKSRNKRKVRKMERNAVGKDQKIDKSVREREARTDISEETSNKDRTSGSDEHQKVWDKQLIDAVSMKIGKWEKDPEKDRLDRINVCLDEGADINVQDHRNGDTVLHVAITKDYQKVVKLALQRGARTDIPNHEGDTALRLAEILDRKEIECILKGPVDQRGELQSCGFMSVADYQEASTARASDTVTARRCTAHFHFSQREKKIIENPGFVGSYLAGATLMRSWSGIVYQLEHLEFTLHCALTKAIQFDLATEMAGCGKLDDLVLRYTNHDGIRVGRFVQLKYSINESNISPSQLLEDDGDFNVSNYFISWLEIKDHELFRDIEVRNLILCTTKGLDEKYLKKDGIYCDIVKDPDETFELKSDTKKTAWYRFSDNAEYNKKLYHKLRGCIPHKLAKLVAKCVYTKKTMSLEVDSFRDYHLALTEYVFDTDNDNKAYKFRQNFIENDNLSPRVERFRQSFLSDYRRIADLPEKLYSEESVWKDVTERFGKLAFRRDFGKSPKVPDPRAKSELPDDIDDEVISNFFEEFTLAVNQPGVTELDAIISRKISVNNQSSGLRADQIESAFRTKILKWFCGKGKRANAVEYLSYDVCKQLLDDINTKSNELVRKPVVKFQGHETSFGKLLDIRDSYHLRADELYGFTNIVDSKTLFKIMLGAEIRIGEGLKGLREISNYYINRVIYQHVVIKKDIFDDEQIPDLLAISGIDRGPTENSTQMGNASPAMDQNLTNSTILENGQEEEQFRALCKKNPRRNIHWLIKEAGKYTWKQSQGDIAYLFEYKDPREGEYTNEVTDAIYLGGSGLAAHDKQVIISDTRGVGKSTLLTYLAKKIIEDEPDLLVLQIDLIKHIAALDGISRKEASHDLGTIDGAVQFLLNELLSHRENIFREVINRIILQQRKVALIVDGFDQIRSAAGGSMSAADYSEPSTSQDSDKVAVRRSTAHFHPREREEKINESPGIVGLKTYPAGDALTRAGSGMMYQWQHLEFTLHCALQAGYEFFLATEMIGVGKLNDIVLLYKNHEGNLVIRCVQLKYSIDRSNISSSELLNDDSNNSVLAYFMSWLEIEGNERFRDIRVRNMILCTTKGLDVLYLEEHGVCCHVVKDPDESFELKSYTNGTVSYKFSANEVSNNKLYDELSGSVSRKLAKRVVKCIYKNEIMKLEVDSFRDYHLALAEHVFIQNSDTKTYKFRQNFIENDNLSPRVERFRQRFLSAYTEIAELSEELHDKRFVWEDIKKRLRNLPFQRYFGRSPKVPNPREKSELPDDIDDMEIRKFLENFTLVTHLPGKTELDAIINRKIREHHQCSEQRADQIGSAFRTKIQKFFFVKDNKGNEVDFLSHKVCKQLLDDLEYEVDLLNELLRKPVVKFQGRETNFWKLLDIRDSCHLKADVLQDFVNMIDKNTWCKILRGEEIIIGEGLQGLGKISNYYINRTIYQHVVIKKDIFDDVQIPDLLAISGIDRGPTDNSTKIGNASPAMDQNLTNSTILENGQEEKQFKALCKKNTRRNIHWLKKEAGKYTWKQSQGDIAYLFKYRDPEESKDTDEGIDTIYLNESDLAAHCKPIIISDTAGMGKSTLLTHLAEEMKKDEPDLLVLQIDLIKHTAALDEISRKASHDFRTINGAVQFLLNELLSHRPDLDGEVFKRLILKLRKVALMVDGFDEIHPKYQGIVIDLLQAFSNYGIKKMFVTTGPDTRRVLERELKTFAYAIVPMSVVNQVDFLTGFLAAKIGARRNPERKTEDHIVRICAMEISKKLEDFIEAFIETESIGVIINTLADFIKSIMNTMPDSIGDHQNKFDATRLCKTTLADELGLFTHDHTVEDVLRFIIANKLHDWRPPSTC